MQKFILWFLFDGDSAKYKLNFPIGKISLSSKCPVSFTEIWNIVNQAFPYCRANAREHLLYQRNTMSKVKITINLDQKNPARVKLKLNILPFVPQPRQGTKSPTQLPLFELPEDIPVRTPEEQDPTPNEAHGFWRRIRFWSYRRKLKNSPHTLQSHN